MKNKLLLLKNKNDNLVFRALINLLVERLDIYFWIQKLKIAQHLSLFKYTHDVIRQLTEAWM